MRTKIFLTVALALSLACVTAQRPAQEGASCKSSADCGSTEFCDFKAGTCGDQGAGHCMVKPEACTREYRPVCGCDNTTYGNDCERRAAGVSLKSEGECPGAGKG